MNLKKFLRKYYHQDEAVSEIVSTLLLITMAAVMFSAIVVMVLNPWTNFTDDSPPLVNILGYVEGNQVVLEHQGGINLNDNTKITITIATVNHSFVLHGSSYFHDSNGNGKWNIGETVVYPAMNLKGTQIKCIIVDTVKNALVMDKTLQQGSTALFPYVTIIEPIDITESSATLYMYYDFNSQNYFGSGFLNFTYGPNGGPYVTTPPVKPLMMNGWYSYTIIGLNPGSLYECWAYMNYAGGGNSSGPLFFYTYQEIRGMWHLDETPGDTIAHDAITPYCNGQVNNAVFSTSGKINNSLHFEGTTQYVDIAHHSKFNITQDITIKAWLNLTNVGLEFPGNISDVNDAMDFSGNFSSVCYEPKIIHVESSNDNIYAIVYHDNSSAYVSTIPIDSTGQIQSIIQTIGLSVPHFLEPDMIHISGDVYAVVVGASETEVEKKGHVVTISIDDTGNIAQLNTFDFNSYYGREPSIIHVSGSTYAITFGGCGLSHTLQTGKLFTITIDSSGNIGNPTIDEMKFPQNYCSETDIIQITSDIFAIVYNGIDEKQGYILTVQILPSGQIVNGTSIDSFQFGLPSDWLEPSIVHVSGDVFAITYGADSNNQNRNGFVQTVVIRSNGTIQPSIISSLAFPTPYCSEPEITPVGNKIFAIAFSGGDSFEVERGYLITVDIDDGGNISGSVDDVYEVVDHKGREPSILNCFGYTDRFVIAYGAGNLGTYGFMVIINVDQVGSPQWILQKGDMFGVKVNGNRVIATMTIGGVSYTVSGQVSLPWNRILLYYVMGTLTLKINGAVSPDGSVSCSGSIKTNLDSLIFGGGFYGSLDEIEIYSAYKP